MSAKWRLLEPGESLQHGDERWSDVCEEWMPESDGIIGDGLVGELSIVRRRMTPAEEHAEELLDMVSVARVIIQKLWEDAEPMREWDPKIHAWLESAANLPTYLP